MQFMLNRVVRNLVLLQKVLFEEEMSILKAVTYMYTMIYIPR